MKRNLIILLTIINSGCDPIIVERIAKDPKAQIAIGVLASKGVDKLQETLPEYEKELHLPPIEICKKNKDKMICFINSCLDEKDCEKEYDYEEFMKKYKKDIVFVKENNILNILSYLETYCSYNEKENKCNIIKANYENINKLIIFD